MDLRTAPAFSALLADCYRRFIGLSLLPDTILPAEAPHWFYEAPFCLVAHNREPDPRFIYANRAAQERFEYSWDEFLTLPSRLSAEPINRAERQRLLDAVASDGAITDYAGVRISKSGRRFRIEQAAVWQLVENDGDVIGQAAMFI
ncbi:MAG TPA: MEKHLA domain-containing protein [Aliidongia sp.]|nr:MEKHLA domain-containing protein [Aliidongia sp.]